MMIVNTDLSYRQGSVNDLLQLKQLGLDAFGRYASLLTPDNWELLHKALQDDGAYTDLLSRSIPFVCTIKEKIVGMAFLIPRGNPTAIYQADWCYIRMVGVHPDHSGKGIARKLAEMCIRKAREMNETTIALHTSEFMDAARHIYESLGFTILKEIPPRYGKKYWLYTRSL